MPVIGPGSEFSRFLAGLEALAHGEHKSQMANSLGAEVVSLVKLGFETSTDPSGRPWEPVLRGGQPLLDSGRLRNAFTFSATPSAIRLENSAPYVTAHQYGEHIVSKSGGYLVFKIGRGKGARWASKKEVTIARRQMVPETETPARWLERLSKVAELVLKQRMGQ